MGKKIIILVLALQLHCLIPISAYSEENNASAYAKTHSAYSAVFKKLAAYKREIGFLPSKIIEKEKAVKDLKNKIKTAEEKITKLKYRIKKDGHITNKLITRIFLINREYGSYKLLSFKDSVNGYIVNYELKFLLKKEETKLSVFVRRKNMFLKLKHYLNKEKDGLIKAVKSWNAAKRKLKRLIGRITLYLHSLRLEYERKNNLNKKFNKKNRHLKNKIIKLIRKLNNSSKEPL